MLAQDAFTAESATMTVEDRPEGLRVVLRASGGKPRVIAVGAFSLTLVAALAFLLWKLEVFRLVGSWIETVQLSEGLSLLREELRWLIFAGLGLATLSPLLMLRSLRGHWARRDVFTLGSGEWSGDRRSGGVPRQLTVNPARVSDIYATDTARGLVVREGGEWLTITTAGTADDRVWLQDEMRRRLGLTPRERKLRARYRVGASEPPAGYHVAEHGDGSALLQPSWKVRSRRFGPGLSWLAGHGYLVFKIFPKLFRGPLIGGPERTVEFWLLVGLVSVITVGLVAWVGYCLGGWTEWWVAPDQFETRRRLFGWRKVTQHLSPGRLLVRPVLVSADKTKYRLDLEAGEGDPLPLLGPVDDEEEMATAGRWLAHRTGWRLEPGEPTVASPGH